MPPLMQFHAAAVPDRYPDRVQQESTLFPLMGWPRKRRGETTMSRDLRGRQIIAKTHGLRSRWLDRVQQLTEAGWRYTLDREEGDGTGVRNRRNMQNCRPTFFIPKGATTFRSGGGSETFLCCNREAICPFCYARWVRNMWARFDFAIFQDTDAVGFDESLEAAQATPQGRRVRGPEVDPGTFLLGESDPEELTLVKNIGIDLVSLYWRQHISLLQEQEDGVLGNLIDYYQEGWKGLYSTRRPADSSQKLALGGLQNIVIEPYKGAGWTFHCRALLLVRHGDIPDAASRTTDELKHERRVYPQPSRKVVHKVIGKTLRYPTQLMLGHPQLAVAALEARFYLSAQGREKRRSMTSPVGTVKHAASVLKSQGRE